MVGLEIPPDFPGNSGNSAPGGANPVHSILKTVHCDPKRRKIIDALPDLAEGVIDAILKLIEKGNG